MVERWVGIAVSGNKVTVVDAEVDNSGPIEVIADQTWKLQSGDRPKAYSVIHQQLLDYLNDHDVDRAIVKASALSQGGMGKGHLEAAELRGVVLSAAASVTAVSVVAKAHISRTFGDRKADEYLSDSSFWTAQVAGVDLRIGSREAALLLLAVRK